MCKKNVLCVENTFPEFSSNTSGQIFFEYFESKFFPVWIFSNIFGRKFFEHLGLKIFRTRWVENFSNILDWKFFEHFWLKIFRSRMFEKKWPERFEKFWNAILGFFSTRNVRKFFGQGCSKKLTRNVRKHTTQNVQKKFGPDCLKSFRLEMLEIFSSRNVRKKFEPKRSKNFRPGMFVKFTRGNDRKKSTRIDR